MAKLPTVAIVGRTNAGKSSLFNRIYGSQEAIVAREAGTTRDNVVRKVTVAGNMRQAVSSKQHKLTQRAHFLEQHPNTEELATSFSKDSAFMAGARHERQLRQLAPSGSFEKDGGNGRDSASATFWLVDTAGLKPAEDDFEATIQDQITEATELADVIVVVVDSTEYPSDEDRRVAKTALRSKKPVLLVVNKTDLKTSLSNDEFRRLGIKDIFRTSAEHNTGVHKLVKAVVAALPSFRNHLPAAEEDDILRLALIGRPNVGKSSLFNSLAGKQQALVANIAGTTRDVNRVAVRYKGRDMELLDTAGIRRSGKQEVGIEKFSVLRSLQAIEEADICFLLMDVHELNTQLDQKLAGIIKEAGKGLVIVVSKWDSAEKDAFTRDSIAPTIAHTFDFVPWAPLIFTSSETGQNVTKLFDLAMDISKRRQQQLKTGELNRILSHCLAKHPPAGLKNTHPRLRYMVQTDQNPPWFVIFGSNLRFLHWSYKRYLERALRNEYDFSGTPIMFSFRDEKQLKENRQRIASGREARDFKGRKKSQK